MMYKFACFILCNGRPDDCKTYYSLKKCGYTGKVYIICDDEDPTLDGYIEKFGADCVKVFNKDKILPTFDPMDNTHDKRCAVYARNACFDIAEELGLDYFCELDDDYKSFDLRFPKNNNTVLGTVRCINLDKLFDYVIDVFDTNENIYSIAFAQAGDFIGGIDSHGYKTKFKRKCMNSWVCKTTRRFTFNGTMNDDVNTYTAYGSRGKLFFTLNDLGLVQQLTQSKDGGMSDLYSGNGTYMKSFYTVLQCPSFVKPYMMGWHNFRIHHNINWDNAVPKIISSVYQKEREEDKRMRVKIVKELCLFGRNRDSMILSVYHGIGDEKPYGDILAEIEEYQVPNIELHVRHIDDEIEDFIDDLSSSYDVTVVTSLTNKIRDKKQRKYVNLHYCVEFYTNSVGNTESMNLMELEKLTKNDDLFFRVSTKDDIVQSNVVLMGFDTKANTYYLVDDEHYNVVLEYLLSLDYYKWYLQLI